MPFPKSLKRFNLNDIENDSTICIIAPRRSGKSFLLRDIMYHKQNEFAYGIVICPSEFANNPFYGKFIPPLFIYSNYSKDLIKNVLDEQKKRISSKGKTSYNRMFVILDDCLQDSNIWRNDNSFKELFYNGRHYNICLILCVQYAFGLNPSMRSNLDYRFVFAQSSTMDQQKIQQNFIPNLKLQEYINVEEQVCKDYYCLVYDFPKKTLCFFKAQKHDSPFRVGVLDYWKYNSLRSRKQNSYSLSRGFY